jgi:hypothetical protein
MCSHFFLFFQPEFCLPFSSLPCFNGYPINQGNSGKYRHFIMFVFYVTSLNNIIQNLHNIMWCRLSSVPSFPIRLVCDFWLLYWNYWATVKLDGLFCCLRRHSGSVFSGQKRRQRRRTNYALCIRAFKHKYRFRNFPNGVSPGWTIGVLGFDSRRGLGMFLFTTASRTALGPTQPPIQWLSGTLSLDVKRAGREADHSPPSSAEVKECVELYLHSSNTPPWRIA